MNELKETCGKSCQDCRWFCRYPWKTERGCLWNRAASPDCNLFENGAGCTYDVYLMHPTPKDLAALVPHICATCEETFCRNTCNCPLHDIENGCNQGQEVGKIDGNCPAWEFSPNAYSVALKLYKTGESLNDDDGNSPLWKEGS